MPDWLTNPAHGRWLEQEGDRLLHFGKTARHAAGGFAWLNSEGVPDLEKQLPLWVTARMTHVYSLAHLMGRPYGALADHGVDALRGRFRDPAHGGWYAVVDDTGPVDRTKRAYEHAFVLLAGCSAAAAERPGGRELLEDALDVILNRFWDDDAGMVVEQWDERFKELDDYRGVNANMHITEALLAAADVTGDPALLDRALRILSRVVRDLAPAHNWRIPEHFDSAWHAQLDYNVADPAHPFRPFGATVGHWLEWARLAVQAHATLFDQAPAWLLANAQSLFDAAVTEGWSVDGRDGFVYTVDWQGRPVVRQRMHWVAAEATSAAAALHATTGDTVYASWYQTFWTHIAAVFVDEQLGSWHHELSPENTPSAATWSGKPDIYHAFQATLLPRLPPAPTLATSLRSTPLALG